MVDQVGSIEGMRLELLLDKTVGFTFVWRLERHCEQDLHEQNMEAKTYMET